MQYELTAGVRSRSACFVCRMVCVAEMNALSQGEYKGTMNSEPVRILLDLGALTTIDMRVDF